MYYQYVHIFKISFEQSQLYAKMIEPAKKGNQTTLGQWTKSKPWPTKITAEPDVTTIRPQITMIPRQPSKTDKPSLPLSKSTAKPTVTTFKTPTTKMPSQLSTTDKSSLPPCIDTAEIADYSDHVLDIGNIVIKNQEQQIPGVTCQELPPSGGVSDYSDDTVSIEVTPVSFLVPIQEKPQVITTQETQISKNTQISITEDTQIPITENPQISITDISQIEDTKLPNPPTQPTRVIQAPKPTTKPTVSTFKTPKTMTPNQTSTTIKLNADEESQIFSDDAVPFLDYDYEYEYDGIVVAEYLDIISTGDSSIDISY